MPMELVFARRPEYTDELLNGVRDQFDVCIDQFERKNVQPFNIGATSKVMLTYDAHTLERKFNDDFGFYCENCA